MKLRWLILLMFCLTGIAGQSPPARKPTLFVVHADWCPPCRNFDTVWCANAELRAALKDAFDVRELDWERPAERADAIGLGVSMLPSYVAVRGTRRLALSEGFTTATNKPAIDEAIAELMRELHVEWPRVRTAISGQQPRVQAPTPQKELPRVNPAPVAPQSEPAQKAPPELPRVNPDQGPTIDQTARDGVTKLITQSRELQDAQQQTQSTVETLQTDVADVRTKIADVKSQVDQSRETLSQQLQQSHESTRSEISTITDRLRETIERTRESIPPIRESIPPVRESLPDILTEIPKASSWLSAGATVAKIGAAIAAPELAVPLSVGLAVAGWLLTRVRKKRGARQLTKSPAAGVPVTVTATAATADNAPSAPSAPPFDLPSLPFQDVDYTTSWADHWVREGKSPELAAKEYAGYVQAFDAVSRGEITLPGVTDGELFTKQVRNWVARQFKARTSKSPDTNNPNHRAFYAFLHKQAFENIRNGKFNEAAPNPKAADVLEDWVNSKLVGELVFDQKG